MKAASLVLNVGSVALVATLGWLVVRSVMGVMSPQSLYAPEPIVAPASSIQSNSAAPTYDFSSDPFRFGESEIVLDDLLDDIIEDAPETTLNLKLKGIVSESSAVFRLADGKDKPVAIDQEVMGGVTLTRTAKDFVILDVNGDTQRLTLERVKLGEKKDAPLITRAPSNKIKLPSREEAENLFSQIQLTPAMEILPDRTTRRQGFKIQARGGVDLSSFGLRSDDVLTRIGPVMLNTNRTNIKELRDLIATGAAQDIEVIRDGNPVTIRIGQ